MIEVLLDTPKLVLRVLDAKGIPLQVPYDARYLLEDLNGLDRGFGLLFVGKDTPGLVADQKSGYLAVLTLLQV